MPEISLAAAGAFAGGTLYGRTWRGFSVSETAGRALASMTTRLGQEESLRAAMASAFGAALPEPGCWLRTDSMVFSWTGPGRWVVEADGDGPSLIESLQPAAGAAATIVDLSDAWVRLHLAGPHARAVLAKLCPLDLHPSVFPVGAVTRTLMDHLGVAIALLDDQPTFALWVERSAARSFLHALVQAADSTCGPD